MSAFDTAFALLKIDEGMWEEIYAPLLAQTTGMGQKQHARHTTDFVPTAFAMDVMRGRSHNKNMSDEEWGEAIMDSELHGTGDHGHSMDVMTQRILEQGFTMEGADDSGRIDPSFQVNPVGMNMYEGNHRLLALNALGAPYVSFMGRGSSPSTPFDQIPHKMPLSQEALNIWGKRENYSLADYMSGGSPQIPPSWLYGREMVPGMGRLEPVNRLGEPIDMLTHIDDRNAEDPLDQHRDRNQREPLNPFDAKSVSRNQKLLQDESLRNNAKWDWKKQPSWKVVHDE